MLYIHTVESDVYARILNRNGSYPSHSFERKAENPLTIVSYPTEKAISFFHAPENLYYNALIDSLIAFGNQDLAYLSVVCGESETEEIRLLQKAIDALKGTFYSEYPSNTETVSSGTSALRLFLSPEKTYTLEQGAVRFDRYRIQAALLKERACAPSASPIFLPYLSPTVFETIVGDNASVNRYPYHTAKRMRFSNGISPEQYAFHDDLLSAARLISLLHARTLSLSDLSEQLPSFGYRVRKFSVPDKTSKLRVITEFARKASLFPATDQYEGIVIDTRRGQTTLVPQDTLSFRLYTESFSAEAANDLCNETIGQIFDFLHLPPPAENDFDNRM